MKFSSSINSLQNDTLVTTTLAKKKGKNFAPKEDVHLAASWLDTSQDPDTGDEQKKVYFGVKIAAQRELGSLQARWRLLQATCNKFAGCYAAIVACNESGKTTEQKILDAHVLFRKQNGASFKS
ncbi:Hypothetical protein PHPALM_37534 [Phytophthora palmivora]|uniref:Uncharacterized protein n=1 Tax=Phytophthora palmivora TaxID=4796 RepID=A0A2P4WX74_9STRA|nr:Hypothetical protein PHPALM_37534 [Phytophthora palmivora]